MQVETVTKFISYAISGPDFFIDYIQSEIRKRDLTGLTNGHFSDVRVTGEHPLSEVMWNALSQNGTNYSAGIIPAIGVTEGNANEEAKMMSNSLKFIPVDATWLSALREKTIAERVKDGLITDSQIDLIEEALKNEEFVAAEKTLFHERETIHVSLWTHNTQERLILGKLLKSILRDMRKEMGKQGIVDVTYSNVRELVNFNFGVRLFGEETEISFVNHFENYEIKSGDDIRFYDVDNLSEHISTGE